MNGYRSSARSDPAAEADAWLVALAEPKVSIIERMRFVRWLKRSPVHVEEYLRSASIRELARSYSCDAPDSAQSAAAAPSTALQGRSKRVPPPPHPREGGESASPAAAGVAGSNDTSPRPKPPADIVPWPRSQAPASTSGRTGHIRRASRDRRRGRWTRRIANIAAAGLLAAVVGVGSQHILDREEVIEAATGRGHIEDLALSDGTQLVLNTNTSVTVKLRRSSRTVVINRGQVFIDVATDPERPFRVISRDAVLTDIGTRFDVYVRPQDTVVTVLDGHVVVSPPHKDGRPTVADVEPVLVSGGEQAAVSRGQVEQIEVVKAPPITAWREQRLEFDNMPLGDIAREFNRYNEMRIDVRDPHIAGLRLSGSFATTDPDSFLAVVEHLPEVKVQRLGDRYTKITREM